MEPTPNVVKLDELIEMTLSALQELEYSRRSIQVYRQSFSYFLKYANLNEITHYSTELALTFLEDKHTIFSGDISKKSMYAVRKRTLSKLDEMYKYGIITSKQTFSKKRYQFHGALKSSIQKYVAYKSESLSYSRIKSIKLYLERFSQYIADTKDIKTVEDLQLRHVADFIEYCSIYTHNTVYGIRTSIKHYLIYLQSNEYIKYNISNKLPRVVKRRDQSFPKGFTQSQTQALLQSLTNSNPLERRDYAILLLAARLGLRSSDITNLKFSNIDWETNEIHIVQQKTKNALILPLLSDVGEAIINYVKNGRPDIEDPHIFLRAAKPYHKMNSGSLYNIVDKYLKRANIKIPNNKRRGPHALRHSLATLLLENNIPITTIKEILAHK
ncbi:MAG: tyrosine-type recombinase/integrase, partial [Campylobacterota bacterium]|nr:tyrosine-type recombinase/integrase [Campylobacterota bacterium]